jgi:hypothetical protein
MSLTMSRALMPLGVRFLYFLFFATDFITLPCITLIFSDISKYFGSDSTGGGIGFQFRTIKAFAKQARNCADQGGDPKDLNIPTGKGQNAAVYFFLTYKSRVPFMIKHCMC